MTLEEIDKKGLPTFVSMVVKHALKRHLDTCERQGQALFNVLSEEYSDYAESIRGTNLDPFNDNSLIENCLLRFIDWYHTEKEKTVENLDGLLPRVVYQMCVHGALIVGSYAKKLVGEDVTTNDYDLLVPLDKWQTIALLIPPTARPNKFGGWRFKVQDHIEIDVWPDTLENYLKNCKTKYGGKVYAVDYINNRVYSSGFLIV
jgi:hypothetical protein